MKNVRQICSNNQKPYIFRGAFTQKYFDSKSGESIAFHITILGVKKYSPGLIFFEFGISAGSIERQDLLGPSFSDFLGWTFTVINSGREVALVNLEGHIVYSSTISVLDEASYSFYIDFQSDRTIVLKTKLKNVKSFEILEKTKSFADNSKMGFAKLCRSSDAYVKVKLSRKNMTFQRSTLYPNLYISDDNKTISNNPQSTFSRKKIEQKDHPFQDILLLNCNKKCVYVLNFRVDAPTGEDVFSIVLTNSEFMPSAHYNITLFTYTRCSVTNFVEYESFCLFVYKDNSRYSVMPLPPNTWHSITVMLNRQRKSASFIIGNHEFQIENGYMFEKEAPVLRSVMKSTEDSVRIYLADSDEFDILTWILCKSVPYVDYIFSFIPISRQYFSVLVVIMAILYHLHSLLETLRNAGRNYLSFLVPDRLRLFGILDKDDVINFDCTWLV